MTIISADNPTTNTPPIPDHCVMQTPRPHMLRIIQGALLRREIVTLGDSQFRFCSRGEIFDDGLMRYEALNTGLYQRFGVWEGSSSLDSPPNHYTWCYLLDLGAFEELINPILDQMSAYDRECVILDITVPRVMREMRTQRTTPSQIT